MDVRGNGKKQRVRSGKGRRDRDDGLVRREGKEVHVPVQNWVRKKSDSIKPE